MTRAEAFLEQWKGVRRRTRAVASAIPEPVLEHSEDGRFTLGDVVRHIAAAERWMWAENACLRPSRYPGHGPDLAEGKKAVLGYLDRMQEETAAIVGALGDEAMEARCTTVGGAEMRVWKWLRLMIEHEIHHRGQLYEMLGRLGVETPPLYGLTEPEVKARSARAGDPPPP